jgi:hypothetical protein
VLLARSTGSYLATREAQIGMIRVGGQPGKKILGTSFQSKPGFGGVHLSSQLRGDIGGSQFK